MSDYRFIILVGTIYIAAAVGNVAPKMACFVGLSVILTGIIMKLMGAI